MSKTATIDEQIKVIKNIYLLAPHPEYEAILATLEQVKAEGWVSELRDKGISIIVKHYESGTYAFTVMKLNEDATGWSKISPFMSSSHYDYNSALKAGIEWYESYNQVSQDTKEK